MFKKFYSKFSFANLFQWALNGGGFFRRNRSRSIEKTLIRPISRPRPRPSLLYLNSLYRLGLSGILVILVYVTHPPDH